MEILLIIAIGKWTIELTFGLQETKHINGVQNSVGMSKFVQIQVGKIDKRLALVWRWSPGHRLVP
jgi:hypothetical protein